MEKSKIQLIQSQSIAISLLDTNDGQIAGVPANPRTIDPVDFANLKKSIEDNPEMLGMRELLVYPVGGRYVVIGGNMRLKAMRDLGFADAPCKVLPESTDTATLRAVLIKDNVQKGEWDAAMLQNDWSADELQGWGVELPEFEQPEAERVKDSNNERNGVLSQQFIIPPFSIFDTRQGYWQERKKMWRDRIGDLGESRECALRSSLAERYPEIYRSSMKERKRLGISFEEYFEKYVPQKEKDDANKTPAAQGVSIFDPVVSEICCKWFTPYAGAKIFDCFSGDTQKGLVFAMCGYEFAGVELRQEQVDINNRVIADRNLPIRYICDDGCNVANHFEPESQDMLFSCPPYFDLEVYSDMPNDASNQGSYEDFIEILRKAFTSALSCLKENRFAVIVVGDVRSKKTGGYYDFVGDIKRIFMNAGAHLLNEIILIEMIGSGAMRAAKQMEGRKVVKTHQNILVFYKGDPKNVKNNFPPMFLSADESEALDRLIAETSGEADNN